MLERTSAQQAVLLMLPFAPLKLRRPLSPCSPKTSASGAPRRSRLKPSHSYAIAIFRFKDYQAANIPVLPVVKGISVAKNHITLYIIAFAIATLMLSLGGYAG
jgi:hypothetical protein